MKRTFAPAARGEDSRLIVSLMSDHDRVVWIKRSYRMEIDAAGLRLKLYDSHGRVTDTYGLEGVTLKVHRISAVS